MATTRSILRRILCFSVVLIAALAGVVVAGVLCSRWFRTTSPFLDGEGKVQADSVATFEGVELGGYRQAVLIRGRSTKNPLLLYLHGGPGSTELPLVRHFNSALEEHFIVVLWEQRGAGQSYSPFMDEKTLTIPQLVSDAHELMVFLTRRFHQQKVVLVGHSWGSYLGLALSRAYPDLVQSYVGIGQEICFPEAERLSMAFTMDQARASNNTHALAELRKVGDYPNLEEGWLRGLFTQRAWLGKFGGVMYGKDGMSSLFSVERPPEFTLFDLVPFALGAYSSLKAVWPQLLKAEDYRITARKLEVPVYFVIGRHDHNAPSEVARSYFDVVEAPRKEWIWFESSAHMPNFEEPEKFNALMIDEVLPEAIAGARE